MSLAPISESEVSVTADLKTAIDPFGDAVTSSLGFRLSSIIPVEVNPPKISTKSERIEEYYYSRNEDIPTEDLPSEYTHFLDQVDDCLVQFFKDHPYRMNVFLTAENEHGARYFLSSFIRPCVLPLISSHTVELAAQFVANLIEYKILFDFFGPPRTITTPNFTVLSQCGDCFDMSILLTTILTGIGYDACVIIGYANRELTLSDLRYRDCPAIAKKEEVDTTDHGPENKYLKAIEGRLLNLNSSFVEKQKNPPPPPPPPRVIPTPPIDEYEGKRLHCWVMVSRTGRIEIPETIFIDVSTGDEYPITSELFGYIEIAFNHKNTWINLQPNDFKKSEDTLDFANPELWQPVIPEGNQKTTADGTPIPRSEQIRMPSPVVERLNIPEIEIFRKYPKLISADGCSECYMKKLLWADAVEELYAPYTKQDGLVRRFFIFDKSPAEIKEVREQFQSLRQHLIERRIFLDTKEMWETFEPGAIVPKKETREKEKQIGEQKYEPKYPIAIVSHKIKHNEWRLLEFDDTARLDRLKSRLEVFGSKIIEKFGDRDDGLMERDIIIVPDSSSSNSETELYKGGPKIEHITQKYRHPSQVETHHTTTYAVQNSVYKVSFDFVTKKLAIVYHHKPGCITDFSIEFVYPQEKDKEYVAIPSKYTPERPDIDNWTMNDIQKNLLQIREDGKKAAEKIAKEMVQWIQFRTEEESRPYLKMKSTDVVLHRKLFAEMEQTGVLVDQPPPEPKSESEDDAAKKQQQLSANDPLCVYFPIEPYEMTQEIANEIYDKALCSLEKRLYDETKYLTNRLEQEQSAIRAKVREYEMDQHQSRSSKQGNEHNNYLTTKAFVIGVLQKRLNRRGKTAARRIEDLVLRLRNHPKLKQYLDGIDPERAEEFKVRVRERIESMMKTKDRK